MPDEQDREAPPSTRPEHGSELDHNHRVELETLVAACLELMDEDGEAALDALCDRHPEHALALRQKVRRLRATGLVPDAGPDRIGHFRIVRPLGKGGMGDVYLAEQESPVRRLVAVKLIKPGMATSEIVARFESERQALAMLSHEGIAQVYEAGTDGGRPYFVMEYVDGVPITDYCDEHRLSVHDRLRLHLRVCDAVQHAHQNGIIHRDLKPSNVLVRDPDHGGEPLPKVIDFGLAKATGPRLTDRTLLTEVGQIMGTPEYMSPEQAGAGDRGIDTRADVYALGVVLYELLVGVLPFDPAALRAGGLLELQRTIRDVEPPRPSSRLQKLGEQAPAVAERRGTTPKSLLRSVAGDLSWITMKAMAKDRDRRYASVSELAADLRRHLAHRPVLAGPPSAAYVAAKFVRRHRGAVAAAVLAAIGLFVVSSLWAANAWTSDKFDSLDDADLLDSLRQEAREELWPARPEPGRLAALEAWIEKAHALAGRAPRHAVVLATHRADSGTEVDGAWQYERYKDRLLDDTLTRHLESMDELRDGLGLSFVAEADTLPSVEQRLAWARELEQRTIDDHREAWDEARVAVAAHPDYGGLDLEQQLGLVPLGPDPDSTLWEFAFPLPGAQIPRRGAGDRLELLEDSCLVLVLVPGGNILMGRDIDSEGYPVPGPTLEVELDPFFVSKYEVSQAQWLRLAGLNPSQYGPDNTQGGMHHTLLHPVENISWVQCDTICRRLGLELPTEAQWEYAARAGTTAPWWTGAAKLTLNGDAERGIPPAANLADSAALAIRLQIKSIYETALNDEYGTTAPVDALRANPFGLHNVLGNVFEWCRDSRYKFDDPNDLPRPRDGFRGNAREDRVVRGGSCHVAAINAHCGYRLHSDKDQPAGAVGFRPIRTLELRIEPPPRAR